MDKQKKKVKLGKVEKCWDDKEEGLNKEDNDRITQWGADKCSRSINISDGSRKPLKVKGCGYKTINLSAETWVHAMLI